MMKKQRLQQDRPHHWYSQLKPPTTPLTLTQQNLIQMEKRMSKQMKRERVERCMSSNRIKQTKTSNCQPSDWKFMLQHLHQIIKKSKTRIGFDSSHIHTHTHTHASTYTHYSSSFFIRPFRNIIISVNFNLYEHHSIHFF